MPGFSAKFPGLGSPLLGRAWLVYVHNSMQMPNLNPTQLAAVQALTPTQKVRLLRTYLRKVLQPSLDYQVLVLAAAPPADVDVAFNRLHADHWRAQRAWFSATGLTAAELNAVLHKTAQAIDWPRCWTSADWPLKLRPTVQAACLQFIWREARELRGIPPAAGFVD